MEIIAAISSPRKSGRKILDSKVCQGCHGEVTSTDYSKSKNHCLKCFEKMTEQQEKEIQQSRVEIQSYKISKSKS